MDTRELYIYTAGHFDGEGCIHITKTNRVRVLVAHTHHETLIRYQDLFGGSITDLPLIGMRRRPTWMWCISDRIGCAKFLLSVIPFLYQKQEKARLALTIIERQMTQALARPHSVKTLKKLHNAQHINVDTTKV